MQLPQILQSRRVMYDLPRGGVPALVSAVDVDGYARMYGIDQGLRIGKREAMMADKKQINLSQQIPGANQGQLFSPGQIAQVEKLETPVSNHHAERSPILAGIYGRHWLRSTVGVRLP